MHKKAQQCIRQKAYQEAHQFLLSILERDKHFADAYFLLAMIASAYQNNKKACQLIEQALKLSPKNGEYIVQLAKHFAVDDNPVKALALLKLTENHQTKSAFSLDTIGVTYSMLGLHQIAINFFKQAIKIKPSNANFHYNLAIAQAFVGDFRGANLSHLKVIKIQPDHSQAYFALGNLAGVAQDTINESKIAEEDNSPQSTNTIEKLKILYTEIYGTDDKLYLAHAIARKYETGQNYAYAFKYLSEAKKAKLKEVDYDFSQDKVIFKSLSSTFAEVKPSVVKCDNSKQALFVVGMPRTGTTLVERILSQHSDVSSVGELEYFGQLIKRMSKSSSTRILDEATIRHSVNIDFTMLGEEYLERARLIGGKTAKFVDKMPLNVLYVGHILKALPNAKILCLSRNPLDSIVSNFRQLFRPSAYNYHYAFDLESTAKYYIEFHQLTKLWSKLYPDNFTLVNYEELVKSPKIKAKQLIEFCDLTWQDKCVDIQNNLTPVATSSSVQIRQEISNKFIGNWRRYDEYLEPVKKLLQQAGINY